MTNQSDNKTIFGKIIAFSLPYLLSCFMQTLYGMADLFIIGQFNGVESTTAVSIGSQVMHMITVMIVGMAMGTTVLIGKAVGSNNKQLTSKAIGNTITLFGIISLISAAILLLCVNPIIKVMSTPSQAVESTADYLTVCFLGIPFITAYNVISSVFRGKGDSKTPMYFVAIACVANIVLDYILVGAFKLGSIGAALGTTLSQAISVIISIVVMVKKDMGISVNFADFRPKKIIMSEIIGVGLPVALQDGFVQISFLLITVFANLRGLEDAAAVGIVEKIIGILFLIPSAMLSTVSALSAQYIGAGKKHCAEKVLRYATLMSMSFGAISIVFMMIFAENAVALFTNDSTVIVMGSQYMRGYVWDCLPAGIHFCFSGYFCACNRSGISFAHNFASIVLARIPLAYLASVHFTTTLLPMGLATVTGSVISVIICLSAYHIINRNNTKSSVTIQQ